ncbi:hypothetical protein M758_UG006200, partial [Ceratodon purpureus]
MSQEPAMQRSSSIMMHTGLEEQAGESQHKRWISSFPCESCVQIKWSLTSFYDGVVTQAGLLHLSNPRHARERLSACHLNKGSLFLGPSPLQTNCVQSWYLLIHSQT